MLEESDRAWDKIACRSYAFHALRDECTHLRAITLQQVRRAGGWLGCEKRGGGARCALHAKPGALSDCLPSSPSHQVRDCYAAYVAPGSATRRRLAIHIAGRAHRGELAAPPPEGVTLVPDPSALPQQLPLWPAVLGDPHACS